MARFIRLKPFPVTYAVVHQARDAGVLIAKVLRKAGGIRFADKIASELAQNLELLEGGLWTDTLAQCNQLMQLVSRDVEIEVARHIQDHFLGFGPKQSRNLLQSLGLTRYEIPIDSRLTDWLNEFGFPVRLTATALGDDNYYRFEVKGSQFFPVFETQAQVLSLIARGGAHAERLARGRAIRCALNQAMADDEALPVPDGAEVAFFPPVTGG